MNTTEKLKVFCNELDLISDNNILDITEEVLSSLPDAFFTKPASSSGHYHPIPCRVEGGLVYHTKLAVSVAVQMFDMYEVFDQINKDLVIAALILHDGFKYGVDGLSEHTTYDHPKLMNDYLVELSKAEGESKVRTEILLNLAGLIHSHHGRWNNDGELPIPFASLNIFVHECDYISSRLHKMNVPYGCYDSK